MKILLSVPGHLKTVPMSAYIFETLKGMGHEVILFNYGVHGVYQRLLKALSKNSFLDYSDSKLIRMVQRLKPDLFLTVFGFDHRERIIREIRSEGVLSICWWLNDPFQIKRSLAQAGFYDYYFTNSKGSIKNYVDAGGKNVFYLPVAISPNVHRKLNRTVCTHDVCFAGDWSPVREQILHEVSKNFKVSIFGPWGKKIKNDSPLANNIVKDGFFTPEEMVRVFNASKIVLNIHTWFDKSDYGLNPRVFEANGCGILQISDYKEEIPDHYEPDKEIVLYKDMTELTEKISYFLNHAEERSRIAKAGLHRTTECHTYEHRLKEMFHVTGLE